MSMRQRTRRKTAHIRICGTNRSKGITKNMKKRVFSSSPVRPLDDATFVWRTNARFGNWNSIFPVSSQCRDKSEIGEGWKLGQAQYVFVRNLWIRGRITITTAEKRSKGTEEKENVSLI